MLRGLHDSSNFNLKFLRLFIDVSPLLTRSANCGISASYHNFLIFFMIGMNSSTELMFLTCYVFGMVFGLLSFR